jgi:hypothetical protein
MSKEKFDVGETVRITTSLGKRWEPQEHLAWVSEADDDHVVAGGIEFDRSGSQYKNVEKRASGNVTRTVSKR